jgi:hypothetical protein
MDDRSLRGKYLRLREELRRAANPSYAKRLREEIERLEWRLAQISQPFADTLPLEYVPGPPRADG